MTRHGQYPGVAYALSLLFLLEVPGCIIYVVLEVRVHKLNLPVAFKKL